MTKTPKRWRLFAAATMLTLGLGGLVQAQPANPLANPLSKPLAQPEQQSAPAVPAKPVPTPDAAPLNISAETKAARGKLDGIKVDLDQKEASLQGRTLSDVELQSLKDQLEPLAAQIRAIIDEQAPRLEASKARLTQLGPKPKDGPEESADVVKDRGEREAAVAELDETQRLAKALLVQTDQIATQVSDRRRASFTRALFEQGGGVFSPTLWMEVAQAIPRELRVQQITISDTFEHFKRSATLFRVLMLGLAIGIGIALYVGRRSLAPRLVKRDPEIDDPSRRSRLLAALVVLLLGSLPAIVGSWIVWIAFDSADLFPPRLEQVVAALLRGIAFVAFVGALIDAVLAPNCPSWRLVPVGNAAASRIMSFGVLLTSIIVAGKVLESFNRAIAAVLPITVMTRAVFALAAALILGELLRRFAARADDDENCLGPYVAQDIDVGGPLRTLGWIEVGAIAVSVIGGYVALASFLVDQALWISIIVALLILCIVLVDEFVGGSLQKDGRLATTLQANTGLRRRSIEQIGVLTNGVARVCLIILALLLALAPWGIESTDIVGSVRAAFFGFSIGDMTISISSILFAGLFFAIGFAVTRIVQRWLDNTFLPATDLDAGLRNSIRTAAGYVGIITTGVVCFTYLGLSLERLTLVAGALSVGIGFGLQSIVNNFISGLILLWERPIRVGDLVVVGDGEGYVRRINVRSTEIQTFDRSTLIVPNSNLISGIVRNRVRNDRMGRVIVSVPVPRASDPDQVAEVMRTAALAHREVMSEPPPRVLFKKVTETTIDFDLVCFVDEIDSAGRVSSDLYFEIMRALRKVGTGVPPAAQATVEIKGLEGLEESMDNIAHAIEDADDPLVMPKGKASS